MHMLRSALPRNYNQEKNVQNQMWSQNKIRSEPTSRCQQCEVNLCVKCFKPYHRQKFPELGL